MRSRRSRFFSFFAAFSRCRLSSFLSWKNAAFARRFCAFLESGAGAPVFSMCSGCALSWGVDVSETAVGAGAELLEVDGSLTVGTLSVV